MVVSAAALLGLLAATGVWLSFFYRPGSVNNGAVTAMRGVHRFGGSLLLLVLIVLLVVAVIDVVQRRTGHEPWIIAAALALLGLVLSVSGFLLPYDQLALRAVTVRTDISGFFELFTDEVRYVLIGTSEVSVSTIRGWFVVHSLVLPLVLGALLWRARRDATSEEQETAAAL